MTEKKFTDEEKVELMNILIKAKKQYVAFLGVELTNAKTASANLRPNLNHPADTNVFSDVHFTRTISLSKTIEGVNDAIQRLREGSYGYCEGCREPIPVQRLKVAPFAIHCVSCGEKAERENTLNVSMMPRYSSDIGIY